MNSGSSINTNGGTLTLNAKGNMTLGALTVTGAGNDITLDNHSTATNDITLNGAITGGNNIVIQAGRYLTQNAGAPITTGAAG